MDKKNPETNEPWEINKLQQLFMLTMGFEFFKKNVQLQSDNFPDSLLNYMYKQTIKTISSKPLKKEIPINCSACQS